MMPETLLFIIQAKAAREAIKYGILRHIPYRL